MAKGELADTPGTEWRAEDSDPPLATPTNEENEKRGRGLPGGGIWEGGDLSVTQVPQKPMMAGDPLRFIACERLVLCPPGLHLGMWGSALQVPGLGVLCSRHGFPCDVYGYGWWQKLSQAASGSCHGPV